MQIGAATTAVVAAGGIFAPLKAAADDDTDRGPRPRPIGINPGFGVRIYGVDTSMEPSSITDFDGAIGAAIIDGTGIQKAKGTSPESLLFDTDMRFMQGTYRSRDGHQHKGTFAFV
ncbi:MAG TPA: hypothetical protein VEU77_07550 [Candidatus Acidoferrales bacterium]|nr:hypothetical protein [Candidatus Acidoferrales bacterium]